MAHHNNNVYRHGRIHGGLEGAIVLIDIFYSPLNELLRVKSYVNSFRIVHNSSIQYDILMYANVRISNIKNKYHLINMTVERRNYMNIFTINVETKIVYFIIKIFCTAIKQIFIIRIKK